MYVLLRNFVHYKLEKALIRPSLSCLDSVWSDWKPLPAICVSQVRKSPADQVNRLKLRSISGIRAPTYLVKVYWIGDFFGDLTLEIKKIW